MLRILRKVTEWIYEVGSKSFRMIPNSSFCLLHFQKTMIITEAIFTIIYHEKKFLNNFTDQESGTNKYVTGNEHDFASSVNTLFV